MFHPPKPRPPGSKLSFHRRARRYAERPLAAPARSDEINNQAGDDEDDRVAHFLQKILA